MQVMFAYSFVVVIWATTPLGVQWSNSSLSFIEAVTARMCIALAVCLAVLVVAKRPLVQRKKDWLVFVAAGLGFFPTMIFVYWSAQHIPSGLISVLFGLFPFFVGLFSLFILNENIFNIQRIVALVIALVGLFIINAEQLLNGTTALIGVLGVLLAVTLFGLNSVWLKSVGGTMDPLRQTTGALLVTTPCFIAVWFALDGVLPTMIDNKSMIGVGYLAIAGSVLSHTAFFFVISKCKVSTVGLITLISPVIAMGLSVFWVNEKFSSWSLIGCALIILSLAVYQGLLNSILRRFRRDEPILEVPGKCS